VFVPHWAPVLGLMQLKKRAGVPPPPLQAVHLPRERTHGEAQVRVEQ
jgi:hypothetical protein